MIRYGQLLNCAVRNERVVSIIRLAGSFVPGRSYNRNVYFVRYLTLFSRH